MRRTLSWVGTAILTLTLLTFGAGPADAAGTRIVRGHSYADGSDFTVPGLVFWESSCDAPLVVNPNQVYGYYQRGGAAGTSQAIGFGVKQRRENGESGLLARVEEPEALTSLTAAIDASGTGVGHVHAYLRRADGWYVGVAPLTAPGDGWRATQNLAAKDLAWTFFYDNGDVFPVGTGTIQEVAQLDPGVTYGRTGVLFGCGGEEYAIDNLRVGTTTDGVTTYDLQGLGRSRAYTALWNSGRRRWFRDPRSTRMELGGAAYIGGDGTLAPSGKFFFDYGALFQKQFGSSRWRPIGRAKLFTERAYAVYKVRPQRRTTFRFATAGIVADPSVSRPFVIEVRARLKAHTDRRQVRRGDPIKVTGTYQPRNRGVRVALERKVGRGWRAVARDRTSRRGTFSFRPRATSVGRWTLRVVAADGGGNLGNRTRTFTVDVKPKPKPKPCRDCGADTPAPTTPTDPPDTPVYNPPDPGDGNGLPDVFRTAPRRSANSPTTAEAAPVQSDESYGPPAGGELVRPPG